MTLQQTRTFRVLLMVLAVAGTAGAALAQSAQEIQRGVEQALRDEGDLRRIEVSVVGNEVTLAGPVPTFWAKSEALRLTFEVPGVDTVASELEIPAVEDDEDLAEDVARALRRYPFYTIWDLVDGIINEGAVTLTGRVTPERDKAGEIFERVAKIGGVQDVQSSIETLPPSQGDQRLRYDIGRRVFSSEHFQRFATMPNPPFHIIVHNGVVTLVGYVQGEIEKRELVRIVTQTQGVLRVEDQLVRLR